ncbi:MAG: matrixin family metalloprotease [Acidimicrobiia bacterium]
MAEDGKRVGGVRAGIVLLGAVWSVVLPTFGAAQAEGGPAIELCCAWGRSLADGQLTYSLSGADPATGDVMRGAIRAWDDALPTIVLREVPEGTKKTDIVIIYTEGSGDSEGLAVTSFTQRGLIKQAKLNVDAPRAPGGTGAVEQITKHEMGHALGLRHANFEGDLMSPIVNPVPGPMSGCDVAGVIEANRWQTTDGRRSPRPPTATSVPC